ncbi:MAG: translation initiation factor IF-2 [Candidatus Eremiobacteraeota bacterium]|nr:translation initiation factor IF-2 [Candidatus Eremiobacteraeota bacterium]
MATGKPRIFELAKELGMSSKDLLALFGRLGLEAKNQLSVVEPKVADLLRAQLKGAKAAAKPAPAAAPAGQAAPPRTPVAPSETPAAPAAAAPAAAPISPAVPAASNGAPAAAAAEPPKPAAPQAPAAKTPPPKPPEEPVPQLRPVPSTPSRARPAAPEQPAARAQQPPAEGGEGPRPGVAPRPGQPGPPPRRPVAPNEPIPTLRPVPAGQASVRPPRPPARPLNQPGQGNGQIPGRPGVAPRPGQGGPGQYQQPRAAQPGAAAPPGQGRRPAGNGPFRPLPGGAAGGPRPFGGGQRPGAPIAPQGGGPAPSSGAPGGRPGGGRGRSTREQLEAKKDREKEMLLEKQRRQKGGRGFDERHDDPSKKLESVEIPDILTVQELATSMIVPAADVIKELFRMGTMATINQNISSEQAIAVARKFGFNAIVKEAGEEVVVEQEEDKPEMLQSRPPVVTVLGHVDHGKTSLLDRIRQANVAAGEAGGITQKIGAYTVQQDGKQVTFIDTPGHEAFTAMRARGAKVTDVAILVVAADDGVMPQTKEAISHIKAAAVPIVVAINKIDKEDAQPDRVKQQLTDEGLQPVEWGGKVEMVPVSARRGDGIDTLLETVLLEAEVKELKANPHRRANGVVIESALDRGRGPVATVLVQNGTLRVGDVVVVGPTYGKIRALIDDKGKQTKKAGPSIPVEIMGLNDVPSAGDVMAVVSDEKSAREAAAKRQTKRRDVRIAASTGGAKVSLETFMLMPADGGQKTLNLILKADGQGSVEALRGRVESLSTGEVDVRVILAGVGGITENDVNLASASNAVLIGFNIRPDESVKRLAESEQVDLRFYQVIYDVENDLKKAMVGMLAPKFREIVLGRAEVREIFKVSKVGSIAGCYVQSGKITRNAKVRVLRDSAVVFEGEIESLRRFKDDVREVAENFECGIQVARYGDLKQGDVIEAYTSELVAPELQPA